MDETLVNELTFKAMELQACSQSDDLFVPLQDAKRVYSVRAGRLRYKREIWTAEAELDELVVPKRSTVRSHEMILEQGDWASTIAMWCHWNYVGRLQTLEVCDLVAFPVENVLQILEGHPQILMMSQGYTKAYSLLAANDSEYASRADLDIPPARVLLAMSVQERSTFSEIMMHGFADGQLDSTVERHFPARRHKLDHKETSQLSGQIAQGKCIVTLGSDFQLLRTVVICVLKISNVDNKVLCQLAEGDGEGSFRPRVVVPATKLREGESTMAAAKRLIHGDLPPLIGNLECGACESSESEMKSKTGIRSVYVKTTYCMHLGTEGNQELRDALGVLNDLGSKDMFDRLEGLHVQSNDRREYIYAWLSHDDFEYLQSPSAGSGLQEWLSEYQIPVCDFI